MIDQTQPGNEVFDLGLGPIQPDPVVMKTGKVSVEHYTSQRTFEAEQEMFAHAWLNVAREEEVAKPGDWIVKKIPVLPASVLIVRGKDGNIRAFYNVCAHRSMRLVWDEKGSSPAFTCSYHGWTFNNDGSLRKIPDDGCFKDVDPGQSGLKQLSLGIWQGFIFVNRDPNPRQSLTEFLGPLVDRVRDLPLRQFHYSARLSSVLKCNWKLAMESQCEAYHVRALHSKTVVKMLSSKDNPFVHHLSWEMLGQHRTNSVPRNPDYQIDTSHLVQGFAFTSATPLVVSDSEGGLASNAAPNGFIGHPDLNRLQSNIWANDQYVIFPNTIVQFAINGWWMHRYWPITPDQCLWELSYYFAKPRSLREEFALSYALALNRDTIMEDNFAVERQQEVMSPEIFEFLQFGEQETTCRHVAAVNQAVVEQIQHQRLAAE